MKSLMRIILTVLVLAVVGFMPLPYTLEQVRPALHAKDFVQIDGGADKGSNILLMAVGVSDVRGFSLFLALLPGYSLEANDAYKVPASYYEDREARKEEAENSTIGASQLNALQVAYQAAGRPIEIVHEQIYVGGVLPESPLAQELQKGDLILKVDEQTYSSPYDLIDQMEQKRVGDVVSIEYSRGGRISTTSAPLIVDPSRGRPSLGIDLSSQTSVLLSPKASFQSHNVGGPSGGLMFSLEIYNQLVAEDITKGQIIAGTGTIDHKGNVGRIGGVASKVRSAHEAGAKVFFVPDDSLEPEIAALNPKLRSNYHEALRAAIQLKSKMEIVPVKTFNDALNYLRQME